MDLLIVVFLTAYICKYYIYFYISDYDGSRLSFYIRELRCYALPS